MILRFRLWRLFRFRQEYCRSQAEYMAIADGKEVVWLKNFLEELDRAQTKSVLYCDNQNVIFDEDSWSKEPCRYVHQGGDNIEVEALRNINWPPR
ncbi:hypothetical protein Tco_0619395 [Tanacetum coccineum]